jgi:hypothetical protein
MTQPYSAPLTIGQEVELEFPGRPILRGNIALWRQVDDFVFAVSLDTGAGKLVPFILVRDADGMLRAELPTAPAADVAVRQLLGLPIRLAVNEQANLMARQVLGGGRS